MTAKACRQCGKKFTPHNGAMVYCTHACRHEAMRIRHRVPGATSERKCERCGNTYQPAAVAQKFCGFECRHKARIEKLHAESAFLVKKLKCVTCGKDFETRHGNKTSCSEECSIKRAIHQETKAKAYARRRLFMAGIDGDEIDL